MKLHFGQKKSPNLFDPQHYLAQVEELDKAMTNPWQHFCQSGFQRGYDPHPLFNTRFYQHRYLSGHENINPLEHYLAGGTEDRDPHPLFSTRCYLAQLGDVPRDQTPLEHFLQHNHENLYSASVFFNTREYLRAYAEVAPSRINALYHYVCYGCEQKRQSFLDVSLLPLVLEQPTYTDYDCLIDHPQHDVKFLAAVLELNAQNPTVVLAAESADHEYAGLIKKLSRTFCEVHHVNVIHIFGRQPDYAHEYGVHGPSVCLQWDSPINKQDFDERNRNIQEVLRCFQPVAVIHIDRPGGKMTPWLKKLQTPLHGLVPNGKALRAKGEPIQWIDEYETINVPINSGGNCGELVQHGNTRVNELVADFSLINQPDEPVRTGACSLKSQLGLAPEDTLVVGGGGFDLPGGFDRFIALARQWNSTDDPPPVQFLWVGNLSGQGREPSLLLQDLDSSELGERLLITDDPQLLPAALEAADVLVATQRQEFATKRLFKYLQYHKPILWFSCNADAVRVMSGDPCAIRPGDYSAGVNQLAELLSNRPHAKKIANANRRRIERIQSIDSIIDPLCHAMAITVMDRAYDAEETNEDQAIHVPKLIGKATRPRVVFAVPNWQISGVNTFIELLVGELNQRDFDAFVLFTTNQAVKGDKAVLPPVPYRMLCQQSPVRPKRRKELLVNYLSMLAPCVFVPNYDYIASTATPELPDNVATLGVLHSDDPQHYVHGYRMGPYWDSIVSVSQTIHDRLIQLNPAFADKSSVIRYGIRPPEIPSAVTGWRAGKPDGEKLRIVYTGRIVEHQKRIFDFVRVAERLNPYRDRFELLFVGDGPDEDEFRSKMAPYEKSGLVRLHGRARPHEIPKLLSSSHIFALTSEFEGLPLSLLEGMAVGLVPVVTDVTSGIGEILRHDHNAMISPIGQPDALVENLLRLVSDPSHYQKLSRASRQTVFNEKLTASDMADQYALVLQQMFEKIEGAGEGHTEQLIFCPRIERLLNVA